MVVVSTGQDYAACRMGISDEKRCMIHGGYFNAQVGHCQTVNVLSDVRAERARQFARYGTNEDLLDGTGKDVIWFNEVPAQGAEILLRNAYEAYESEHGKPTFRHLVLEEVAEAMQESSPHRLREELLQVAALAVSWVEKLDARTPQWEDVESPQPGDAAFKKGSELDPREVTYIVGEDQFMIRVGDNDMVGPVEVEDYTFRRRVR